MKLFSVSIVFQTLTSLLPVIVQPALTELLKCWMLWPKYYLRAKELKAYFIGFSWEPAGVEVPFSRVSHWLFELFILFAKSYMWSVQNFYFPGTDKSWIYKE